jgi:hypothetical protein
MPEKQMMNPGYDVGYRMSVGDSVGAAAMGRGADVLGGATRFNLWSAINNKAGRRSLPSETHSLCRVATRTRMVRAYGR